MTRKRTISKLLLSLLLCFCLLPLSPTSCKAATYQITETELTQLEAILTTQETALNKALTLLSGQGRELTTLKSQLQTALSELTQSKEQIRLLKASLNTALSSIDKANLSLKEYEKEMKSRLRVAKWQRNIWAVAAVGVGVWAVVK